MAFQFIDRSVRLPSTGAEITQRLVGAHDDWLMTDAERSTLHSMLTALRPQCAIEVGVYRAGSLGILASLCKKVYALDIDPVCENTYTGRFPNVEFATGPSEKTLPDIIDRIQASGESLEFVLIDADHSAEGVQGDLDNVLRYRPHRPLYIVMHDSFNPDCRSGMRKANWSANPHAHMVELDFVPGRFVTQEEARYRQMWCGFALGILLPEKRTGAVIMRENESLMFQTAMRRSVYRFHRWWNPMHLAQEIRSGMKRLLQRRAPNLYQALRRRLRPESS